MDYFFYFLFHSLFQEKDSYGNEVTQLARPLPVEYLLVDMAAAFPVEPEYTFPAGNGHKPFAVENRVEMGESADFNSFTTYMAQFAPDQFLLAMSDFHVQIYMYTCDMLPLRVLIQFFLLIKCTSV